MDNVQLRDHVATQLNAAIDIPIIGEAYEQIFFARLVEEVWGHIPYQVRQVVSGSASLINASEADTLLISIKSNLLPRINQLIFWKREDAAAITDKIATHLVSVSVALPDDPVVEPPGAPPAEPAAETPEV